jgi:hypothetical protein
MQRIQRFMIAFVCWLLVVAAPIALVLLLMPVIPAAQEVDTAPVARQIYLFQWVVTGVGAVLWTLVAIRAWRRGGWLRRTVVILATIIALAIHMITQFKMTAERMFEEPSVISMLTAERSVVDPERLALCVEINGDARAYPIDLLAHHHKLIDTVGGVPIMPTYCTLCHTGRVFSPVIDGKQETFRLVGLNHMNAMIEDASTKSWWYQATGECIAGPRRGQWLTELSFIQTTIELWTASHPATRILQPDPAFSEKYQWARGYDHKDSIQRSLDQRGALVYGIVLGSHARAYPAYALTDVRVIMDTIGSVPIRVDVDKAHSTVRAWNVSDAAVPTPVMVYEEYWRSWRHFHPTTTLWKGPAR